MGPLQLRGGDGGHQRNHMGEGREESGPKKRQNNEGRGMGGGVGKFEQLKVQLCTHANNIFGNNRIKQIRIRISTVTDRNITQTARNKPPDRNKG